MLIENGISNYGICHGAMEIQTSTYYIYMEKVSNGILLKVRYNEMTTYFTNMIVKNQNQALGLIEGRILESKEEQQNEQKEIKKEETQEETQEEDNTITFLNNEGHVTSAVIVSKDNPYLKQQCNHDLIQTTDGKYWELWTTYNGYLVAIDTDEYDQTETQETSYNYGKDSVDTQSISRSEYCEKLKPFTNYVEDMARYHRHDYNELIKTEYNTTKKALELFTVGDFAFIPNTLDGKKEYLKGMLDTTKKDIRNLVLNNDESDYKALELFYRLHAQLESTKGLLNELCGFKNEMILR